MLFNVDKALSLPDIRHIVAKRDEVLDRFGPIFRDPQSLTKQDYLDFLSFKHNHHWTGLERLGRRATDDMESLRGAITVLVSLARRKIPCRGGTCQYRGMRRDDICLYLSPADRARLETLVSDRNTPRKLVWRAEIVLATADGHGTAEVMRRARTSKPTVWRWQQRYLDAGVAGLMRDKTRPARVPPLPRETRLKVIAKTVRETPANATHWSRSLMAEAVGISPSSVGRIWAEAGLKPHLTRSFKVSNDPMFEEKVTDIVGLYLDPPERAVVLCVDEKSQIEALDRTQPGLPLKEGHPAAGPVSRHLRWVFIAVALGGIAVTIYARLDDWNRGRR